MWTHSRDFHDAAFFYGHENKMATTGLWRVFALFHSRDTVPVYYAVPDPVDTQLGLCCLVAACKDITLSKDGVLLKYVGCTPDVAASARRLQAPPSMSQVTAHVYGTAPLAKLFST